MIFLNYFPNGDEEISLIKFVAKYQYLSIYDVKYFFNSQKYYRKRITSLVEKKFLRRSKLNLILDEFGIEYVKLFNFEYVPLNRNQKYKERLLYISNLGAFFHKSKIVKFTPSYIMKDKEIFTIKARRFIGILEINGFDYLSYYISKNHDTRYIASVIYDIQKERKYKNILILINDKSRINLDDFSFGMNQVLIVEDTDENREKLEYLNSINKSEIIKDVYKNKMVLSEYSFCDYTDHNNIYASIFYFFDTEKISRIKYFLRENKNKNADIICSSKLEQDIRKELPNANYIIVDMEKYIDKERRIYD